MTRKKIIWKAASLAPNFVFAQASIDEIVSTADEKVDFKWIR